MIASEEGDYTVTVTGNEEDGSNFEESFTGTVDGDQQQDGTTETETVRATETVTETPTARAQVTTTPKAVTYDDGSTATFEVTVVEQHRKTEFPTERVYGNTDQARST